MRGQHALKLAVAETRRSRGTLLFCVLSVALGVFALTAGRTLTDSLNAALSGQAKQVLGADLVLGSREPLDGNLPQQLTEELVAQGATASRGLRFFSMLTATEPKGERTTQFVRVRAVGDGFPFYGKVNTIPKDQWPELSRGGVLLDESVLQALSLSPGDPVKLGNLDATVLGAVVKEAGSVTAEFSMAPLLYIHESQISATGLLQTGSRVQYQRLFQLPSTASAEAWKERHWDAALEANLTVRTSKEAASNVRRFFSRLSNFLSVVALITLFLAALGIGAAMNSFMASRVDHAVILRCLGARSRDLWLVYSLVALLIALVGSALGAALGAVVPLLLSQGISHLGQGLLPADIPIGLSLPAVMNGLLAGVVASLGFMLLPIWKVAFVSPLRVLGRRSDNDTGSDTESPIRRRLLPAVSLGVIALCAFALSAIQTDSLRVGIGFTAAIGASLVGLVGLAKLLMSGASWLAPRLLSYPIRQGFKNLYRPGNQTTAVLVSIGLGFLLIACLVTLQSSLERALKLESEDTLPNLFVVDVQPDQQPALTELLQRYQAVRVNQSPMISARIRSVAGKPVDKGSVEKDATKRSWQDRMRTREYFVSYRGELIDSEQIVAGRFWQGTPAEQEVSLSDELARNLGAQVGDKITLGVEGLPVEARITSLRKIQWEKMRENVMILLSPGDIEQAPHSIVATARIEDRQQRLAFQSELVSRYPNVTVVDVTQAAQTVLLILSRVSVAFRSLGLMALITGAMILAGAITASQFARRRESTLLKVLGASKADLRQILGTEYLSLSALGIFCGWLLTELIVRVGIPLGFDADVHIPYSTLAAVGVVSVALSTLMGLLISRKVSAEKPLELMRES